MVPARAPVHLIEEPVHQEARARDERAQHAGMFDEIAAEEDERRRHGCTMATAGFSAAIRCPARIARHVDVSSLGDWDVRFRPSLKIQGFGHRDKGRPVSELWIGTSGYVYPHWRRGVFYPEACGSGTSCAYYAQPVPHGRAEQSLLPAARAGDLRPLARCGAGRLPVRGQGEPLHHPHQAAARRLGAARALHGARRAARSQARARSSSSCRPPSPPTSAPCAGFWTSCPRIAAGSSSSATRAGTRRRSTTRWPITPSPSAFPWAGGSGPTS